MGFLTCSVTVEKTLSSSLTADGRSGKAFIGFLSSYGGQGVVSPQAAVISEKRRS